MTFDLLKLSDGIGVEVPNGEILRESSPPDSKYGRHTIRGVAGTYNVTGNEKLDESRAKCNQFLRHHLRKDVTVSTGSTVAKKVILFSVGHEKTPCVTVDRNVDLSSLANVSCNCKFNTGPFSLAAAQSSLLTDSSPDPSLKRKRSEDPAAYESEDEYMEGKQQDSEPEVQPISHEKLTMHAAKENCTDLARLINAARTMFEIGQKDPAGNYVTKAPFELGIPVLCMPICDQMVVIPKKNSADVASSVWGALSQVGQVKSFRVLVAFPDDSHREAFDKERQQSKKMAKKARSITLIKPSDLDSSHRCVVFDTGDRPLITSILMRGAPCLLIASNLDEASLLSQNFGHLGSPTLKILSNGGYGIEVFPGRTTEEARAINQKWIDLVVKISTHPPTVTQLKKAIDLTRIYDVQIAPVSNNPFLEGKMELEC